MTTKITEKFVPRKEELIDKRPIREVMEIDENYANTTSVEASDQCSNANNKIDQKENNVVNRLPRKEFRKLMKKQRKKNTRIEAAKAKQHEQEEGEEEAPEVIEALKAEEKKRNAEKILWEVRERQINQANAEKKKKQEENERMKKIIQENWEKTIKNIKLPKSIAEVTINNKNPTNQQTELGTSATSPSVNSVQEDLSEKTDYGTEKDQINCPFYLKTGACRYGDSCGRHHQYPEKSVTILVKNMYEGMPIQLADEDNDDNLEEDDFYFNYKKDFIIYDEVEAERHYFEFFEDVHTEFLRYGTIVQFKVCNNFQLHLRGNVYVQYSNENEAKRAIEDIRGRWYAGKQLICDYCPVTKWKPAICGYYQRNQCPKGIQCNFLHVYKNPGGLYSDADRDFEDKRSDFIMTTENSSNITVSTTVNKSFLESISINSTQSSKRSQSPSSDKSNSHHSIVKRNSKNSRRKSRSKSRSRSHSRSPPVRFSDKYRHRNYKRDSRYRNERNERDERHRHHHHHHRSRHHKKRDRDLNELRSHRSHHRGHWDRKPDYYDMDVDKNKKDRNENDDRKIQRRDSERDLEKNSKTNKNNNQ
ncbi:U2 small nuclear ribonucleoprotein auxiliary factor 35 kDa subunit-related protein 2 [Rhizophagus clarus]|uniref:U2 small nuclear ribonucleoprotein auxiliary factor 35 kDa subunit-related protein 2 n=1 Tax=Rhizophagus clarus TaxID=94130 RepID=A0A8H3R4L2_9GLOM|nr:U2 small nuclear ribonucleoprotein auxiliary factor 35 kDa subunit-related protein 2 [Rhizophagus clarus]